MTHVERCNNRLEWDKQIMNLGGHPLQLWGWGEVKALHGWQARRLLIKHDDTVIGVAQLLIKKLPAPFKALVYVPRGPACEDAHRSEVLMAIADYAKTTVRALLVTVEPHWERDWAFEDWRRSSNTILIPRTLVLDLNLSTEQLLANMTAKTRYNIRRAEKEAVEIREVKTTEEMTKCLEIYKETAARAGFALHGDAYYKDIFGQMGSQAPLFAAYADGNPVSFTWFAQTQMVAFELYGGMNETGRKLRANYLLKWQVIQEMKKRGVQYYDFNGLLNDKISTFKEGFASHENLLVGTYDKPLSALYPLWNNGLPLIKKIFRYLK